MRKKVKTFTQFTFFENDYRININCAINENSIIQNSNRIACYNKHLTKEQKKQMKKYREKNKDQRKKYVCDNKEYANNNKKQNRIDHPEKFKVWATNSNARRKGFGTPKPINDFFEESELHHLHINNHQDCIYIPKELHNSIRHYNKDKNSMDKINIEVFKWLLKQI